MALFSVWDWNKNLYRVYADSAPVSVGVDPQPPRPRSVPLLGAIPYEHAKVLPPATRFMGLSHVPRGEVVREAASVRELLGLGGESGSRTLWGTVVVAAVAATAGYFLGWSRRQ